MQTREYKVLPKDYKVEIDDFREERAFLNKNGIKIFNLPVITKETAENIIGHEIDDSTYCYKCCEHVKYITDDIEGGSLELRNDCLYTSGNFHIVSKESLKSVISVLQRIYENYEEYITNILEYSISDFLLTCSEMRERDESKNIDTNSKEDKKNPNSNTGGVGYIYVMKNCGYYKIGKSNNCNRLGEYTKLPEEPEYIVLEKVYNYGKVETALHERYADKRLRNGGCEWFNLTEEDLKEIKQFVNKYMYK